MFRARTQPVGEMFSARSGPRTDSRRQAPQWTEAVADIVRLDQPAAGEPLPPPHANLFGVGGEGLRCQLNGGATARGLRDIIGILERLEHPLDNAAVTNRPGADLGAR
jgi:hypothetical protein